ncbi:MAG: tRNA uridine-5-carboxymethylaminomethyl(34) synthesis GTPase MnmE [Proteobacteria bacterium]|nr:tRNA uridine-5-carboxymethylaminomethyl(34) synthesis GTPase MnmE [Pseudomonadota bacterium]
MADDTIVAISTPPGRSGIGIVRVSGALTRHVVEKITGGITKPRQASLRDFRNKSGEIIDRGIVIRFAAPRSFTGEDVAEFHAHGSLVVLQLLFEAICAQGARPARPGEFTERAFRHGKMDLAQAEAIADLINSRSVRAARSALRTMRGEFSRRTNALIDRLHLARAQLEASIDFPEDIAPARMVEDQIAEVTSICEILHELGAAGRQGAKLNTGAAVAIVGPPNVGKSTLMNTISGEDKAIVSELPGTTRDVIECDILIRDVPIRLYDTAGLRESDNPIEREGIDRALRIMQDADIVLMMTDTAEIISTHELLAQQNLDDFEDKSVFVVHNKIDILGLEPGVKEISGTTHVFVSARVPSGLDYLCQAILDDIGLGQTEENEFVARERHLAALAAGSAELDRVNRRMLNDAPEIAAECYRRAARYLSEISGAYSTEDMLGEIFSRFCIGK